VLIDLALDRHPHAQAAAALIDHCEARPGTAYVAWHSLSNFHSLVTPRRGRRSAREFLSDLGRFVSVAPTTNESLRIACELPLPDFEDAIQVAAALACRADVIVTRNLRHFARSPVRAVSPSSLLAELRVG
jgi:predicted nucleic acid-binding protein